MSVRLKLTLSYAGFLMVAGALLLAVVWVFLLRYVPDTPITAIGFVPNRSDLVRAFAPRAAEMLVLLLAFGLLGGWLLAGRMLAPLTRITGATRMAANGSLSHRIGMEGRSDEFRELAGVTARVAAGDVEERLRDRERRAQLVGRVCGEPLLLADVRLEPREHGVEAVGEFAELVVAAFQLDSVGERSGRGRAGGVGDARQGGEHAAGEQPPSGKTEEQQKGEDHDRGRSEGAQQEGPIPGNQAPDGIQRTVGDEAQEDVGRLPVLVHEPSGGDH